MNSTTDPPESPLGNVVRTVEWLLAHLGEAELEQFKSELPRWDTEHQAELPADPDVCARELGAWLRSWIQTATG